ncbi:unnamed protein product [Coffea canephora]|uniref:Uncharacterized protein n=1 Tax=Coffea canephora TaxID=49390 RepID=A0A068UGI3_COFCA|nr:unnamed protein product [Coffea canephora]
MEHPNSRQTNALLHAGDTKDGWIPELTVNSIFSFSCLNPTIPTEQNILGLFSRLKSKSDDLRQNCKLSHSSEVKTNLSSSFCSQQRYSRIAFPSSVKRTFLYPVFTPTNPALAFTEI